MDRFIETDTESIEIFFNIFIYGIEILAIPWDQLLSCVVEVCRVKIGIVVTLISASVSYWKHWRWLDRNFLRCKKRWKSPGARSALLGGWRLNTTQLNFCRCVDRWVMRGHRAGTADDEFRSALSSVHSKTLSQTALHSRRVLEKEPPSSTTVTMLLW